MIPPHSGIPYLFIFLTMNTVAFIIRYMKSFFACLFFRENSGVSVEDGLKNGVTIFMGTGEKLF